MSSIARPANAVGLMHKNTMIGLALAVVTPCIYNMIMEFTWSRAKRSANLKYHGLDFVDAPRVFEGATFTFEDDRFSYASNAS
jgi:hypothetical protein